MKISFQTKDESNKLQQEAFLNLSKEERIKSYFNFLKSSKILPTKIALEDKSDNFIIEFKYRK